MNTLRFYPNIKYRMNNLLFELKNPIEEILFHLVDDIECDIDGFNLFTINNDGIHFKTRIKPDFGLDLDIFNRLRIIGMDVYDL